MSSFEPFDPRDREPLDPRDDFERALSSALSDEAGTVPIAGTAMARIQARLATSGSRNGGRTGWLFSPAGAVAATAVVAVVIGGGVYGVFAHGGVDNKPVVTADKTHPYLGATTEQTAVPSIAPSVTASAPVVAAPYPTGGIFPSAHDVEDSPATYADPEATANLWLSALDLNLGSNETTHLDGDVASITYYADSAAVTEIHLVKWDNDWVVTGANDGRHQLRPTAPAGDGELVTSPVVVSGAAYGHHETAEIQLFAGTTQLGHAETATFDSTSGRWAAWLPFTAPATKAGTVIATSRDAKTGTITHFSAETVRIGSAVSTSPTTTPAAFYGISSGSVDEFDSSTGTETSQIVQGAKDATLSDLQDIENNALYAINSDSSGCNNRIVAIDPSTGAVAPVLTAAAGYTITGYGVSADSEQFSLAEEACDDSSWQLVGTDITTSVTHAVASQGNPPAIIGNPVIGLTQTDFIEKTGNSDSVIDLETYSATSWNDSVATKSCGTYVPDADQANAIGADVTALVVGSQGSADTTQSCGAPDKKNFSFSLPDDSPATSFSIAGGQSSGDGFATQVIEADASGDIWIWNGTALHKVNTKLTVSSPAW